MTQVERAVTRGSPEGASVEAVDRAARVLFALAAQPIPSGLAEVAQRAGLTKPTAFRILATLIAEGFAAQNAATGAYRLGAMPLRMAATVLRDTPARERALAPMRKLRDQVNETVVFSIRQGDFRYNVDHTEAANAIAQAHRIGVPIPLYTGAGSRALLACMGDDDIDAYLDRTELVAFSATTLADRDALWASLRRTRADGYAVSDGEFTIAGHSVAMAVRDGDGAAIASLHVSVPRSRFSPIVEERCVAALSEAVAAIGAAA